MRDAPLLAEARVVVHAHSVSTQAIAVRAGLGVALLPCFVGDPDPSLRRLFDVSLQTETHLWLLIHADLRQTARVRAFVDHLTTEIHADKAVFEGLVAQK
ncbi:MAG: hypothetical protein B7733_02070 [Myxococcales bacterium FL481]|nr:MAG: hypothetical protein B7733_02070 [Myxococcales bacterium FL481]